MNNLVNWYWEHGVKRGFDPSDPDRELRKISIGSWLDPVVRIAERNHSIHANANAKACLALWGPSQSGKSTMMSQYVDGYEDDGSDSALTWDSRHKTRFSPPLKGIGVLPADTLVFNPYNHKSDASGIATRYTLKSSASDSVNTEYPIEIKFTTRAQIIQSLSLGYLSECEREMEEFLYTKNSFLEEVSNEQQTNASTESTREAYWLIKDIANVIECMKGNSRFNNLFKTGEWDRTIRKALVSSSSLLSSKTAAEKFMAKVFWDSADKLTRFYKETERLVLELQEEWKGCKILATMEVGALLLDIDSFKSYVSPEGEKGLCIKNKVTNLSYKREGNEIHIYIGSGGSKISGDAFGYFQAICAELIVPLKKESLENFSRKSTFLKLAEKCDFLDFPGVSNKNTGRDVGAGNAVLLDLKTASPADIFTKVFKQGKTQCFVYNYVKSYGIDAFAVLVRTDSYPSQASLLNAGIGEWLRSFKPEWVSGKRAEMPLFINMTFFASLINSVNTNGVGNGLNPYIERIGELSFARKESAQFFATTYHQFTDGKLDQIGDQDRIINDIIQDPVFTSTTGLTEENLKAVCEKNGDGGLEYMFHEILNRINPDMRVSRCRSILDKDRVELSRLITSQLPSTEEAMSDERKMKLRECFNSIENALDKIEDDDNTLAYLELADNLKTLFSASCSVFDPIPQDAVRQTKKDLKTFVKTQTAKWYEDKVTGLEESEYITLDQKKAVVSSLRDSIDDQQLIDVIKRQLGQIRDIVTARAARYPFSLAFCNLLQYGKTDIGNEVEVNDRNPELLDKFVNAAFEKDSDKTKSPYYKMVIEPLMARIDALSENSHAGERPPQDGDEELAALFKTIETSNLFQIM